MTRRVVIWSSQVVLVTVVAFYAWRALSSQWKEFRTIEWGLSISVGWVLGAALVVLVTYALLIAAWRWVVVGWAQQLSPRAAVHVWTVANLGRYLPGKVWSVAGLAVLAQRVGVSGWASVGAAVAMQALALGTAVAVAAVAVPAALEPWQLVVGGSVGVAVIAGLTSERLMTMVWPKEAEGPAARPLAIHTAVVATVVTALSWMAYGVAFWLLARGLLTDSNLGLREAIGVFVVGYVAGLLAIFAPGGIGVREAVYVAMLGSSVGSGGALVLAAGSRLLLTGTEITAAAVGLLIGKRHTRSSSRSENQSEHD